MKDTSEHQHLLATPQQRTAILKPHNRSTDTMMLKIRPKQWKNQSAGHILGSETHSYSKHGDAFDLPSHHFHDKILTSSTSPEEWLFLFSNTIKFRLRHKVQITAPHIIIKPCRICFCTWNSNKIVQHGQIHYEGKLVEDQANPKFVAIH
jgi:hypothetical protein